MSVHLDLIDKKNTTPNNCHCIFFFLPVLEEATKIEGGGELPSFPSHLLLNLRDGSAFLKPQKGNANVLLNH